MSVTRDTCISSAMAGGLDRDSAIQVVDTLLRERKRIDATRAAGEAVDPTTSIAQAWGRIMDEEKLVQVEKRRQAAINVLKRQELDARREAVRAEGFTGMDFIESLLVGSNKRFFGARDSIDAKRVSLLKDFQGGLINDLEKIDPNIRRHFTEDKNFSFNVVKELLEPGSTGDELAGKAGEVLARYMEMTRQRLNDAGASIGKLEGYIPQSHDAWKLTAKRTDGRNPRAAWVETMLDTLDVERSFPDIAADKAAVQRTLENVYDNISIGKEANASRADAAGPNMPRNLASGMGKHRVLHFKDAEGFMRYNDEYGKGGIFSAIAAHLDSASRNLSLMEALGPNPEYMLRSLMTDEISLLRESFAGKDITTGQQKALRDLENSWNQGNVSSGRVAAWWSELTGEANYPANTSAARAMSMFRASQTLSKLGGAALSAVADVFIKAMNMRVHGLSWGESITGSMGQYFKSYKGQEREVARQLGAFIDSVNADMRLRWDANESMPGKLAGLQDTMFKWSGLNWITETGKAGYAMWFSGHLGEVSGKAWGQLDAPRRATLEYHGFNAARWDLIRGMTETLDDGRTLVSPQRADFIPDSALRSAYPEDMARLQKAFAGSPEQLALAESAFFNRTRQELRTDVMAMITDETQYAIIEPDAKTRAFMRQGTRPGTVAGEFWRTITQFKSFPIAYMQRQLGGRRWVRGDLQAGMRRGVNAGAIADSFTQDIPGVVGAALSAYAFGYMAMTAKDFAKGKKPRDPFNVETTFAALAQSGGAGIFGDFLFNKVDRFGNSFAGTVAGPLAGEVGRVATVAGQLLRGDFESAGEDGLRVVLDNAPFVNLWYTREALNFSFLYHIREMLSPGTLKRTERKMLQEYGQEYFIAPSGVIRKGGGFR